MIDLRRPRLAPLEAAGVKSTWTFFVLALLNIVDAFNLNVVWPMLPFMVESYHVARHEEDLGAWVGTAGAAVSVGQLLSSFFWGIAADKFGRRPVMLLGMVNSTFSVLVFGTSTTYAQCVAGRFLSGLLNGNAGVVKTYIGETTEKREQVKAFSIFALAFGIASCVAPGVGGFLQRPAETWPEVFRDTVFDDYPFLLPMLAAAALTTTGGVLGFMYVPETASQWRRMERRRRDAARRAGSQEEQFWRMAMEAKGEEDFRTLVAEFGGARNDGTSGGASTPARTKQHQKRDKRKHRSKRSITGEGEHDDGEVLLSAGGDGDDHTSQAVVSEVEMGILTTKGGGGSSADAADQNAEHAELGLLTPPTGHDRGDARGAPTGGDGEALLDESAARSSSGPCPSSPRPRVSANLNPGGGDRGWDRHTVTASACYAGLAAIAIGYDEILPVYAKTSRSLGGLELSAKQIGVVLVVGGVALIVFQTAVFPTVLRVFGVTRALRVFSLAFAGAAMIAPLASLRIVVERDALMWTVLLISQTVKIVVLAVLFTTVIMAVNNSCKNEVKARVNGAGTAAAALGRIISPVVHGVVFSSSLRLHVALQQFCVFGFVAVLSFAFFILTCQLPSWLDHPPAEEDDAQNDDGAQK